MKIDDLTGIVTRGFQELAPGLVGYLRVNVTYESRDTSTHKVDVEVSRQGWANRVYLGLSGNSVEEINERLPGFLSRVSELALEQHRDYIGRLRCEVAERVERLRVAEMELPG